MRIYLFFLLQLTVCRAVAQVPDSAGVQAIKGYTITTYKEESIKTTSLNISQLEMDSMARFGNFNLSDMLARTPGVSMLSTGIGIAKPVIRGLYGNRVLVLLAGLKFDNQQWQEEHGLGLTEMGLSKVELIKGPMSVLYGSEAMGGIINLVEEDKPKSGRRESDIGFKFNSNTLGGTLNIGYRVNYGKKWFRIRVAADNNADYSDGSGNRVLNSRFDGYALKSSFGFRKGNWISNNHLSSSFNRFGFIFNDVYTFVLPDERWSRRLNVNPAHLVLLNILSSENKLQLKNGSNLSINAGIQSNKRMENEGGGAISLNMHLLTGQYLVKLEKKISDRNRLILSHMGVYENNTNYGARKIVPDATMQEANLSAYLETEVRKKLVLENGVGIGEKYIHTLLTASVNSQGKEIQPFTKFSPYYNFFSGLSWTDSSFNLKFNAASGVRIPNLAELSSDGLHEGVFTYEIGDPLLKNEQNISLNCFANYSRKAIEINISPFYNRFFNYVFLAPTTETWNGFPVFRFRQQDAEQFGTELTVIYRPRTGKLLMCSYSGMQSKTLDGNFTPYTPAQKIRPHLQYTWNRFSGFPINIYSNLDYLFAQKQVFINEKSTPSYYLLNAGLNGNFKGKKYSYEWNISGNNILNKAYYDHLSRFKNFGLLNLGRNIAIGLKIRFNSEVKRK